MERNNVAILSLLGGCLLAAAALGFFLKGGSEAQVDAPVAAEDATAKPAAADAKATKKMPANATKGPRTVPEQAQVDSYTTTESGLEYHDLVVGDGPSPKPNELVVVEYSGWFEDGKLFDSSYNRTDPFKFPLGQRRVIKGWDEGVATMKVGGKRQLKVPGDLAYGPRGKPPKIPPNATLIFDVELLEILPPRKSPEAPTEVAAGDYTTTETGLQYYDMEAGTGLQIVNGMMVEIDYTGWLEDGTKFDSSLDRPSALVIPIGTGRVIPGWDQGIVGMKVGGKRQLKIPYDLAYGEKGKPPVIPPKSTLIFDVHVTDVKNAPKR